jgi:hypothetical protein
MSRLHRLLSSRGAGKGKGKGGFKGLQPIKTVLNSVVVTVTSGAASALSVNSAITFNATTFPELADYSLLYDEARVKSIMVKYFPYTSAFSGASPLVSFGALAIEFDPSISGPSSVNSCLESTHSVGPWVVGGPNGADSLFPSFLQFHKFKATLPKLLMPIVASDCVGQGWFTLDTTAPVVGVVNGYQTALGTSGQVQWVMYYFLECEFRMRT